MTKRFLTITAALVLLAGVAPARQNGKATHGIWSGVIVNGSCSADDAFAERPECTKKGVAGARLALYDDTLKQLYLLDPQEQAIGREGDSVEVGGTLEGNVIHVTSLETATAIGLAAGEKAPDFSARDQFGREQDLKTLKGSNGTVLLFFRSADW